MKLFNTQTIELTFDPKEVRYNNIKAFSDLNEQVKSEIIETLFERREIPVTFSRQFNPESFNEMVADIYEASPELASPELTTFKIEVTNKVFITKLSMSKKPNPVLTEVLLTSIIEHEAKRYNID